jgi:superfamily I DNA and RNA helicase
VGEGHRAIHGVAGSGKTMILGYRAQYLAQALANKLVIR